jgi:hypothetical protein
VASNILTKPFQAITFQDVVDCCKAGTLESAVLDYKLTIPRDLSKHFATFSNTHGGLIIIGVEEDESGKPKTYVGLKFESKLVDQIHQFAANVSPFPRYAVRATDEVKGKVFIIIKIFAGDQPPYMSNSDPTIRMRTGNVSTPLRNLDSRELEKLYEKRNRASDIREEALAKSVVLREAALKRAVDEWEEKRKEPETAHVSISPERPGSHTAPFRVTIMPVSPSEPIIDYREVKRRLNDYRVQARYVGDFPDLNIETVPGGVVFANWSWTNSHFEYGFVSENGVIDSIEDVLNADLKNGTRQIWMGHMVGFIVRQLDVARKFYNIAGFNGLLVCRITLDDAVGVNVFAPKPDGWQHSYFDRGSQLTKLGSYEWEVADLDTMKLNDIEALSDEVLNTVERFYWDFDMGGVNKEMLEDYLRQLGWEIKADQASS